MPTHPLTKRFPVGTTHRITVNTVRETRCDIDGDQPEKLYRYWQEVIATQPDHEADKESVVVVMLTTRLRPFAWHRVASAPCRNPQRIPARYSGRSSRPVPTLSR